MACEQVKDDHGASAIGLLASPHSTVEELALAGALVRGLGSENIDSRLRHADFTNAAPAGAARWLGMPIAGLSTLQRVLVVGSNLRKDHPLFAQRIRQAARHGGQVNALIDNDQDWAMSRKNTLVADSSVWVRALAGIAVAVAAEKGMQSPVAAEASRRSQSHRQVPDGWRTQSHSVGQRRCAP